MAHKPPTPLGKVVATTPRSPTTQEEVPKSRLAQLATSPGARRGELVRIPGMGLARIEILGAIESNAVESEVSKAMRALEIGAVLVAVDRAELERAWRTLARAVRDPDDPTQPFGTAAEWGDLDADMINAAWQTYGDVRQRLDPLAEPLTDEEAIAIESAVKKGDGQLLRSFGLVKLSGFLLSMVDRPSISTSPSSPSSESSSTS